MAKSEKLYSKSPKLKRDEESGKVGVEKPTEATKEDIGLEGNPLEGAGEGMPIQAHEAHQDMVERHIAEFKDLHKRHEKEHEKLLKKHSAGEDDKLEGTPAKKIEKDK